MAYAVVTTDPAIAYLNSLQDLGAMYHAVLGLKMKDRVAWSENSSLQFPYEALIDRVVVLLKKHDEKRLQMDDQDRRKDDANGAGVAAIMVRLRDRDGSCSEVFLHNIVTKLFLQCCGCCTCNLTFKEAYVHNIAWAWR